MRKTAWMQSRWPIAASAAMAVVGGMFIGIAPASADSSGETKFGFVPGTYQEFVVPSGETELLVTARGGGGGKGVHDGKVEGTVAAEVSAVLDVRPGDVIRFGVGGVGQDARGDGATVSGGWGGLAAEGGDGAQCGDRVGGAGGGATTVQLVRDGQATTLMVAGGGGGGGNRSPGGVNGGDGGHGGDNALGLTASGSDGRDGQYNTGSGGKASGQPGSTGEGGQCQNADTPGGGGGGGVNGGNRGLNGTKAGGGGGGAGSSMIVDGPHYPTIKPADQDFRAKNGEFKVSEWS